ncbi:hypothetical protein K491DRAFT_762891 [Lophiostoma macrostomum CBS 122681]|uniref:Uncharacterized protein n=1 Tax=Lophiostoma macrostomum CBS 122681 TaxID=1314788 RepID=A0A6A6SP02_9PLEO|nr:hypothetical protein K491DRAFT_762891 [Lophiostoma macrostomum CBS 122681]
MKLLALFGLLFSVSMVPGAVAPFTALLGLEGAVAGVLLSVPQVKKARDGDEEANVDIHLPPGVPQYVLDMCAQELVKSKVVIDQHPDYSLRLNGVPPTCMNLAVLFAEQGRPIPCGSACLDYKGLSDSDLKSIIEFFNSHM